MFSRFDIMLDRDRQTDVQTSEHADNCYNSISLCMRTCDKKIRRTCKIIQRHTI